MTRKSNLTDSLKSEPMVECDKHIKKCRTLFEKTSMVQKDRLTLVSQLEKDAMKLCEHTTCADMSQYLDENHPQLIASLETARSDLMLADEEQKNAYISYKDALTAKYNTVSEILSGLMLKETDWQESVKQDDNDMQQAVAKIDKFILESAVADIVAQIKDLDKKQQAKKKRNPAPSKTKRIGAIAKKDLTKEIAAVLAEVDKVKTIKTAVDNTARYRLKSKYLATVVEQMIKKFNYKNVMEVPKLEKIILNMGLGDVKDDAKEFNKAVEELKTISGQKPVATKAKKSIANFKVRQGQNIGAKVTLRGNRMYEFADKFISVVLPRVRDFKGVNPNSFDGRGNYALGVKEQLIFPEIKYDQISKVRGLDVCFVTSAKTDEEAKELLRLLGMPFKA